MKKARAGADVASHKGSWRIGTVAGALLLLIGIAYGQETLPPSQQTWVDYDPTWQLKERWIFDNQITLRHAWTAPTFWEFRSRSQITYSPRKWLDLTGAIGLIVADQITAVDTFEVRPVVGVRFKHTIWRGIELSNFGRLEFRFQFDMDNHVLMSDRRYRNRSGAMIPINKTSLSAVGGYYGIIDAEWFWNSNKQIEERFNSRRRYRAGIGWKMSQTWNFQFLFVLQKSRDTIGESFKTTDDIYRIRFIHTIK
jgi:hypothetical protein